MCGRYYIEIEESEMRDIINATQSRIDKDMLTSSVHMNMGEIRPSNIVPVQVEGSFRPMKWGFHRFDGSGLDINARSETAEEKPAFKKAMQESRCLIPATNYFEWKTAGKQKIKHAFHLVNSPVLYMAGIYRLEKDSPVPTFVILTRDASDEIKSIHDRMPVIIPCEKHGEWLREGSSALAFTADAVLAAPVPGALQQESFIPE